MVKYDDRYYSARHLSFGIYAVFNDNYFYSICLNKKFCDWYM